MVLRLYLLLHQLHHYHSSLVGKCGVAGMVGVRQCSAMVSHNVGDDLQIITADAKELGVGDDVLAVFVVTTCPYVGPNVMKRGARLQE